MAPAIPTLRDYMRMVFRRKLALLIPALLSVPLIVPLWVVKPAKFRAVAVVRREHQSQVTSAAGDLVARQMAPPTLETLRMQILSAKNLAPVIEDEKLGLNRNKLPPAAMQPIYEQVRGMLAIRMAARSPGQDMIEIAAITNDPVMAARLANKVADVYVKDCKAGQIHEGMAAADFFRKGVADYALKLKGVEDELDIYLQKNYESVPEVRASIQRKLYELRTQETTRKMQITAARERLAAIRKQLTETPPRVQSETTTGSNPGLVELNNQILERQKLLDRMLGDLTPEHPDVKRIQNEIALLKEQIKTLPDRIPLEERQAANPVYQQLLVDQNNVSQELDGHTAALQTIAMEIATYTQQVEDVTRQEKRYGQLLRLKGEYERTLVEYQQKHQQSVARIEANAGQYGEQVDIQEYALPPSRPYRLDHIMIALGCLAGGVAVGLALMFGLEFADHSLRSADDAAAFLGLPVLGTISTIQLAEVARQRKRTLGKWALVILALLAALAIAGILLDMFRPDTLRVLMQSLFGPMGQ